MITKDSIESAYCFFHQKWRVYVYSTNNSQKEEIEYAISSYVEGMNDELYSNISEGKEHFLLYHKDFTEDMSNALKRLEKMMSDITV